MPLNLAIFSSDQRLLSVWQDIYDSQGVKLKNKIESELQIASELNKKYPELATRKFQLNFSNTEYFASLLDKPELQKFLNSELCLKKLFTQPVRLNRGKKIFNPIYKWAEQSEIDLETPENWKNLEKSEIQESLENIDLAILGSYGQIIPKKVIQAIPYGILNWHPSLLPKYRGASPVQAAILNSETSTGLSFLEIVSKMDAGDIYWQSKFAIKPNDTTESLMSLTALLGANFWAIATLNMLAVKNGIKDADFKPQNSGQATYSSLVSKTEKYTDPSTTNSLEIYNKWKAYQKYPGIVWYDNYFDSEIKIVEARLTNQNLEKIKQVKNSNWFVSQNKTQQVYYLCQNQTYLEILKIRLASGKEINFRGYNFL